MAVVSWLIVGLYVISIFIFNGQESSGAEYTNNLLKKFFPDLTWAELRHYVFLFRKTGHFLAYAILTLLAYFAARRTKRLRRWALFVATLFSVLVALGDEYYQQHLPYRTGSLNDVLYDAGGILTMILLLSIHAYYERRKKNKLEEKLEDEL